MSKQAYNLEEAWMQGTALKSDLLARSERYARWTIPHLFPEEDLAATTQSTLPKSNVLSGSRLVTHLSHRIVNTMFPTDHPFFNLRLTPEGHDRIVKEDANPGQGNSQSKLDAVKSSLRGAESAVMRAFQLTRYRPAAVQAVQHLIVTGNALIFRDEAGKRMVYSLRDYCVWRRMDGTPFRIILRDAKTYEALSDEVKSALAETRYRPPADGDKEDTTLYTQFEVGEDKRWHTSQAVNGYDLDLPSIKKVYTDVDLPALPLAWDLARGDDYGRGLVEFHEPTFNNLDIMRQALLEMISLSAEVRYLVDPASGLRADDVVNSTNGEFLSGRSDAITALQLKDMAGLQTTAQTVESLERELAQAFLLASGNVRNAERVTAEEIRYMTRELEEAFGGLYSRLALDWQQREAEYEIARLGIQAQAGNDTLETVVTAGVESLTREGRLQSMREALNDLSLMNALPEGLQAAFSAGKFASFVFTNHGFTETEFLKSPQEMVDDQAAQQRQQEELLQMQAEADLAKRG